MCQISSKLHLCTCVGDKPPKDLESFWELYCNIQGGNQFQFFIGRPLMPLDMYICGEYSEANEELILHLLNEGNCFDFPYVPNEGDCLVLYLKPTLPPGAKIPSGYMDKLYYSFQYISGKWVSKYLMLYHLDGRFKRVKSGEVINPFQTAAQESDISALWDD